MKGCRREFLTEYLQEFIWRDKFDIRMMETDSSIGIYSIYLQIISYHGNHGVFIQKN